MRKLVVEQSSKNRANSPAIVIGNKFPSKTTIVATVAAEAGVYMFVKSIKG